MKGYSSILRLQLCWIPASKQASGSAEQIQYIMRDESNHMNFGIDMINTIKEEQPELWTPQFVERITNLVKKAVVLEYQFVADVFQMNILDSNADGFKQYIEYIADRRLARVGINPIYGSLNPFPWMSKVVDLSKES